MSDHNTLGIDIGGSRLRAAVVSASGQILSRAEAKTPARAAGQDVVDAVSKVVQTAMAGQASGSVIAAGVCAPGPLDAVRGIALSTPTIDGFRDFPLRDQIAKAIGLPTFLDHDGHAAAFGEWSYGAGRGSRNMVYVTVSTGIGGGAIVDGQLQRGRMGMAAHVGHMTIVADGPVCNCGNRGCWEALAAGPAFTAAAQRSGFADGAAVFAAAQSGDSRADALVQSQARWLAIGMVNLLHIYSPELIVLGGGVSSGLDLMRPHITAQIAERAMPPFRDTPFVIASLRDNSGLIGAAALGRIAFSRSGDPTL